MPEFSTGSPLLAPTGVKSPVFVAIIAAATGHE
jgi:hypothetical protein